MNPNFREVDDEQFTFLCLKFDWHNVEVRTALAIEGIALNKLATDSHITIRCIVARHGYNLDTLANDNNSFVREIAEEARKALAYQKTKSIVDEMFGENR